MKQYMRGLKNYEIWTREGTKIFTRDFQCKKLLCWYFTLFSQMRSSYDFGTPNRRPYNCFVWRKTFYTFSESPLNNLTKYVMKIFSTNVVFRPWVQKFLHIPKKIQKFSPDFFTFWPEYHDYVMEKLVIFVLEAFYV